MINVLLIDDEVPFIRYLNTLLDDIENIKVVGTYTDPVEGLDAILELNPQVVFLDIEMPQFNGLDVASMIFELRPEINIVFVTAHSQYAVEAFELYALDYILKPISKERLNKTIERLDGKISRDKPAVNGPLYISCLKRFEISWKCSEPIRWRTTKTMEIMAYLIHMRNKKLTKDEIIDSLYPDVDLKRADHLFRNAIYYIKKALTEYGISKDQIYIDKNYSVKLGNVFLDYEEFINRCSNLISSENTQEHEDVIAFYCGKYFELNGWIWSEGFGEYLANIYLEEIKRLADISINEKNFDKAEHYLQLGFDQNPYDEEISKKLIELYIKSENRPKAVLHYNKLEKLMKDDLGIVPNKKIREIALSLSS